MGSSCVVTVAGADHLVPRGGSVTIGTADSADIRVDDQRVQGLHARIDDIDGQFLFVDDSADGSFLGDTGRAIRRSSYLLPGGTTVMRLADPDDGTELSVGVSTGVAGSGAATLAGTVPPLPSEPSPPIPAPAPLPPQDPVPAHPLPSSAPPPPAPPAVESPFALPGSDDSSQQPVPAGGGSPPRLDATPVGPAAAPSPPPPTPTPTPPPPPPNVSAPIAEANARVVAAPPRPAPPPPPPPVARGMVPPGGPSSGAVLGAPARPWWKQPAVFVVLGVLGLVVAVVVFTAVRTVGTTSAADIQTGRCYEQPDDEFTRLREQDCAGVHDLEIVHTVQMLPGQYPSSEEFESEVSARCGPTFDEIDWDALPADADGGWFEPNRTGWELGDHTIACYVYSDSGIIGRATRLTD